MYVDWTKHLRDDSEKADFEKRLRHNHREVLDRLLQLLDEDERSLNRSETDPKAYENTDWAFLQAHKNGYRAHLNKVRNLIESVNSNTLRPER